MQYVACINIGVRGGGKGKLLEIFQGTLFLKVSATCSKILNGEKIFGTMCSVYIPLEAIRVIWASVVCHVDQRRDWL